MTIQQKMNNASAKPALNNLKTEVANELGLSNYEQADKGNLSARQNGYVGGYMTKSLLRWRSSSYQADSAYALN